MTDIEFDLPEEATILDGLIFIKDNVDDSLAFRRSCRAALVRRCPNQ